MQNHRAERVQAEMRRELARVFERFIKDPRARIARVSRVEVSADLRHAKVFISVVGDAASEAEALQAIRNAGRRIRGELSRRMRLRRVPELHFVRDETVEDNMRIADLLQNLEAQRRERGSDS